ncbi:MAG: helix-turn-helix transcriptional regulator [Bacteriovorax sp.]|nr:helix-turn-helix transcriptional regulator [Bacteriovorax sp.]
MKKKPLTADIVKKKRKELKLTQEELAMRVGVGLRFLRDVEQGKESVRLDKLNLVLRYMGLEVSAVKMRRDDE